MAARECERRRALVHRACDAHDRPRDCGPCRQRRGRGLVAKHGGRPRRRHLSRRSVPARRRALRRRQRFEYDDRSVRRAATARMVAAVAAAPAQRDGPLCGCAGRRNVVARGGAGRRARARPCCRTPRPRHACRPDRARRRRSRARRAARGQRARRGDLRTVPPPGARRDERRALDRARRSPRTRAGRDAALPCGARTHPAGRGLTRDAFSRTDPRMLLWQLTEGNSPLIVSVPHAGRHVPDALALRMDACALTLPDTDWHVDALYRFVPATGATFVVATHSRYVVDLNRDPSGAPLYAGADNTELCPTRTFANAPVYRAGEAPAQSEIDARRATYFAPYHALLARQIERVRSRHGYAMLLDGHSIAAEVPRFFA